MIKLNKCERDVKIVHDIIFILGDGWSAQEDLEKMRAFQLPADLGSLGRSIKLLSRCDHWFNVDSECAIHWAGTLPEIRTGGGMPIKHTLGDCRNFDADWDIIGKLWELDEIMWHGSTALFAVMACHEMGYKKIVLGGCPLDSKGHWYWTDLKVPGPIWNAETYQAWFEYMRTEPSNKVRSFSGYTEQMLGKPTKEWLIE